MIDISRASEHFQPDPRDEPADSAKRREVAIESWRRRACRDLFLGGLCKVSKGWAVSIYSIDIKKARRTFRCFSTLLLSFEYASKARKFAFRGSKLIFFIVFFRVFYSTFDVFRHPLLSQSTCKKVVATIDITDTMQCIICGKPGEEITLKRHTRTFHPRIQQLKATGGEQKYGLCRDCRCNTKEKGQDCLDARVDQVPAGCISLAKTLVSSDQSVS